ncbi:hypothetical protein Lrub_2717 [Legionella rubrilucens]|uniref:YecA family protein n=1 Tax=Legionella rubrilucens TaxID=458 RepID=A0A0W0XNK2_9GAMM|nr:UPF0149 family protein [Legionella rubrilucens]KTD45920.1 hypothetical protein Lrub_2717 [Legionella rubrilucens]
MPVENHLTTLPDYQAFTETIAVLALPISSSELHGMMCGYLCAGASQQGESYLRALAVNSRKDEATRVAAMAMFSVYALSEQQINTLDFEFQLLLPDDHEPLLTRAQAFSEWCEGFTQGMTLAGVGFEQFTEEDSQDTLQHITEFAELDYQSLDVDEEDEKALMEVSEYTRMAVLRLYSDLQEGHDKDNPDAAH